MTSIFYVAYEIATARIPSVCDGFDAVLYSNLFAEAFFSVNENLSYGSIASFIFGRQLVWGVILI